VNLTKKALIATALGLLIAVAWNGYQQRMNAPTPSFNMAGDGVEQLPEFSFPDVQGINRNSSEWKNRILVINFWATWCPPCREEMPLFVKLQKQYADKGVQFVAIAIDEPDLVRDFHDVYGLNFPTLIGGMEAVKLANTLGNRFDSLPFTAIFDRQGKTHHIQAGPVTNEILIAAFDKLLPGS